MQAAGITLAEAHIKDVEIYLKEANRSPLSDVLQKIIRRMNEGTPYVEILDFVYEVLKARIPFDRISIALFNENQSRLKMHWVRSNYPPRHLKRDYEAPVSQSIRNILQTKSPRLIGDLGEYLRGNPTSEASRLVTQDGIKSSLTCPLYYKSEPLGLIFFSSSQPNTYNVAHINAFMEVAEDVAVIVQNGRLQRFFDESKSKDRLMAMVVHDLRSPASIIYGFLNLIAEEDWYQKLDGESQKIFAILNKNVNSILKLLADLSDSNQVTSGQLSVYAQMTNIRDFLKGFDQTASMLTERKEIKFQLKLSDNLPDLAYFDPIRIQQALENLVTNAIKFSNRDTEVDLEVRAENERLIFSVRDQGQGIPADELSLLFKHFGKTSVKPTANEPSSGLGLFIVKNLIEAHGGRISVESRVNEGSIFSFWIPINPHHSPSFI